VKIRFATNIVSIALLILGSCSREEGNIIIEGQDGNQQMSIFVTDTLTLHTKTVKEDSLPGNGLSYALLGSLNDPIFGNSKASIYADLTIVEPNNQFPNTLEPDSAILFIPSVDGLNFYGDRNYIHNITIAPITENIDPAKTYYQTDSFPLDLNLATQYTGQLINEYKDSLPYRNIKLSPYKGLRVKLSTDFAKFLMNMDSEAYETNAGLDAHLKGIALIPNSTKVGNGSLAVMDLTNIISNSYRAKILLYYSDTQTFMFGFSGKSSVINRGETGPYKSEIQTQLDNPKENYTTTYVQALSGVKTEIQIPYLLNLAKNGNISIQKAEIEFSAKDFDEYFFTAPRLSLFKPFTEGSQRNFLIEDAVSSSNYGGTYNRSNGTYTFTITRHLQNIINAQFFNKEDINLGLYLAVPSDQPVIGARSVIDHTKTRLLITYVKPN